MAFATLFLGVASADAETRTLKLFFIHTKEKAEITFKRNGSYDQAGLRKINQFLRDWRRNEPTKIDPRLLDLVWSVYQSVGARDYINVVSAYRSPATNSMLRSRSKGVAKKSQHMLGKAMDFYIPGVSLKKLRETGLKMQVGGVGYYPRSGSPFVHLDVGNVRHWPKMSRSELAAVFPNGKTLHIPSDGKPLPGFDQALASYQARKKTGATALALASSGSSSKPSKGLLAALFGGGEDEDEEGAVAEEAPAQQPARKALAPVVAAAKPVAKPQPQEKENLPGIQIVSPNDARRVDLPVAAEPVPEAQPEPVVETPETIIASLPSRAVPLPEIAPRPQVDVGAADVASAGPGVTDLADATLPVAAAPPATVPFGMAEESARALAEAPAAEPEPQIALNIPVPTPRPNRPAPPAAVSDSDQDAVLMALASADRGAPGLADPASPMPSLRPAEDANDAVMAILPGTRPGIEPVAAKTPEEQAALAAAIKASEERVAALANASKDMTRLTTAAISGPSQDARTTRKVARATRKDGKPDRKAVVVAAQPDAARWVLTTDLATAAPQATTAPSFAYNAVVTAPREVYTAGFHTSDQQASAHRFSGKAVEFLSVARFE